MSAGEDISASAPENGFTAAPQGAGHIPVMLAEVLDALQPKDGETYVDGTFGAGGYTSAILERADCRVYAIDRDPEAIRRGKALAPRYNGRLQILEGCFGDMPQLLAGAGAEKPDEKRDGKLDGKLDGIVLDIGVSSMQINEAARGFSFQKDGPLDMRMSQQGPSAADIVNTAPEKELADIIYTYGEERASRAIARKIVEARNVKPIETTAELARIIHAVLPMHGGIKTDTATRTFQALRIYVNDELGELERALAAAEDLLKDGGRLVVVTFHSLEDGIVKNFFRDKSGKAANVSRHLPQAHGVKTPEAPFTVHKSGGVKPSDAETQANPRARSARLRYGIRRRAGQAAGRRAHA